MSRPTIKLISQDKDPFAINLKKQTYFQTLFQEAIEQIEICDCQHNLELISINGEINYQKWKFSFTGKNNFDGKEIKGTLNFPYDYPSSPPQFLVDPIQEQTVQHMNIYGNNQFCLGLFSQFSSAKVEIIQILQAIEYAFNNPSFVEGDAPANPMFCQLSDNEQDKIQQEQATHLPQFIKL